MYVHHITLYICLQVQHCTHLQLIVISSIMDILVYLTILSIQQSPFIYCNPNRQLYFFIHSYIHLSLYKLNRTIQQLLSLYSYINLFCFISALPTLYPTSRSSLCIIFNKFQKKPTHGKHG